jgi:hypothetical protein
MRSVGRPRRRGFTLIELLVVMVAQLVETCRKGGPLYARDSRAVAQASCTGKWLLNTLVTTFWIPPRVGLLYRSSGLARNVSAVFGIDPEYSGSRLPTAACMISNRRFASASSCSFLSEGS